MSVKTCERRGERTPEIGLVGGRLVAAAPVPVHKLQASLGLVASRCSATVEGDIVEAVEAVERRFGRVDVLRNTAAAKPFSQTEIGGRVRIVDAQPELRFAGHGSRDAIESGRAVTVERLARLHSAAMKALSHKKGMVEG